MTPFDARDPGERPASPFLLTLVGASVTLLAVEFVRFQWNAVVALVPAVVLGGVTLRAVARAFVERRRHRRALERAASVAEREGERDAAPGAPVAVARSATEPGRRATSGDAPYDPEERRLGSLAARPTPVAETNPELGAGDGAEAHAEGRAEHRADDHDDRADDRAEANAVRARRADPRRNR